LVLLITDILNIANIDRETYSIKSYFGEIIKVENKTVNVKLNSRPGVYEKCSVIGYDFPKEGDKGVIIFIGGFKLPVFAKLFNYRTDGKSQFRMGDENSDIKITEDHISFKSYQGLYTHFDTEAIKQGLVEGVDFRYQTHIHARWSDTTRRYARKEVIDAIINLIKNWNIYINKDSRYLIGVGDLSKKTEGESANFHDGTGHHTGRGMDLCNNYLCDVKGLNDGVVSLSQKLFEYSYRYGLAEYIIFNAPSKYVTGYENIAKQYRREYSSTAKRHTNHFHLSWVGGRVG